MIMAGDQERAMSKPGGPQNEERDGDDEGGVVGVRVQALDEVVSVNSFLTGAVFIGLAQSNEGSLVAKGPDDPCYATPHLVRQLLLLEVLAFSCFLMSSLLAQGLKVHLTLCRLCSARAAAAAIADSSSAAPADAKADPSAAAGGRRHWCPPFGPRQPAAYHTQHPRLLRFGVLATSVASLFGTVFLVLSIVMIVQLRLGLLSCHSAWAKLAVVPLVLLVACGGFVFSSALCLAFRN